MQPSVDLEALEREAYRASWSDGIIDIYIGLSLIWLGTAWIWITEFSALAGIIPAVLLAPALGARKRFVESRLGYVQWRSRRRSRERRDLWLILGAGIVMLMLGALLAITASSSASPLSLAPGIMAWLLALLVAGGAILIDAVRLLLYAALLAASGVAVVLLEAMPGWPMLITGIAATAAGLALLRRFVRRYPPRTP